MNKTIRLESAHTIVGITPCGCPFGQARGPAPTHDIGRDRGVVTNE
ncbi:MAG: hypothetical protein K0R48_783 [Gammaproteobacteria bacterium]|jgi:hypothetical protein|nr:hypothetical protein [Gammaproteobacteria bacterium]